jgi:hypothetical protein
LLLELRWASLEVTGTKCLLSFCAFFFFQISDGFGFQGQAEYGAVGWGIVPEGWFAAFHWTDLRAFVFVESADDFG